MQDILAYVNKKLFFPTESIIFGKCAERWLVPEVQLELDMQVHQPPKVLRSEYFCEHGYFVSAI